MFNAQLPNRLISKPPLANAINIIEENRCAIDTMVDVLMEKNHLKENEIDEIFNKTVVSTETK